MNDLKDLFDKEFFTFTLGFVLIIVVSMSLLAVTGYYKAQLGQDPVATPVVVTE